MVSYQNENICRPMEWNKELKKKHVLNPGCQEYTIGTISSTVMLGKLNTPMQRIKLDTYTNI